MVNGAGRAYSRSYGFGLLNATRLVAMARTWQTVASQLTVGTQGPVDDAANASSTAAPGRVVAQAVDVTGCSPGSDGTLCIAVLEHVVVRLAATVANRGLLDIAIISPTGTVSQLMAPRIADRFAGDFAWDFMTLQHWGEPVAGTWTLRVGGGSAAVTLRSWAIVAHGTTESVTARQSAALGHTAPGFVLPRGCSICEPGAEYTDAQGNCGLCDPGCPGGCAGPGRAGCVAVDDDPDGRAVAEAADDNAEARRAFIVFVGLVAGAVFIYSLADQIQKRRAFDRLIATHNEINHHQEPLLETDALPGAPRAGDAYEQRNASYEPPNMPVYIEVGPAAASSPSSASAQVLPAGDYGGGQRGHDVAAHEDALLDQYALDDADHRHGADGTRISPMTDDASWFPSLTAAVGAAVGTEPTEHQHHQRRRLVMNDSTMDASAMSNADALVPFFPADNTEESSI